MGTELKLKITYLKENFDIEWWYQYNNVKLLNITNTSI